MKPRRAQYAVVYETDGSTREVAPANGRKFDYKELQVLVGGYLASLTPGLKGCRQMYADEEGLLKRLPPNPHTWQVVKTDVYRLNGYSPAFWRVAGPIVAVLTRDAEVTS